MARSHWRRLGADVRWASNEEYTLRTSEWAGAVALSCYSP